jgi:transcriptional regulator of acetoin/glycerol metabolism
LDLRVVCASNRDLRRMMAAGEFREDLYYRLNGILLELPQLTARADKDTLIRRLLVEEGASRGSIDAEAFDVLVRYTWPGNVRELRNVIRSAFAICDDHHIRPEDLPANLLQSAVVPPPGPETTVPSENTLAQAECAALLEAIRAQRGNLCHTAQQLGISRNCLYRKLKRHGIAVNRLEGISVSGRPCPSPKP